MRNKFLCTYFIFSLLIVCFGKSHVVKCQSERSLEQKRNELLEKIDYTNDLLQKNRRKQTVSTENLRLISSKIETRRLLIRNIEFELEELNNRIENNLYVIESLNEDLKKIMMEYEKMVFAAYKNRRNNNIWLYVLSSESFNKAYRRYKYLSELSKYRKKQSNLIVSIKDLLESKNISLAKSKIEKQELLFAYSKEADNLKKEICEEERLIVRLKNDEKQLRKEIEQNKKNEKRIADEIQKLIRLRKQSSNADLAADNVITEQFKSSIGKLNWPVTNGVIVGKYGQHYHEVLKEVKVNNIGIDISTEQHADVYSVFDGVVSSIVVIMGTNSTVLVKHGSFFTVYQNLVDLRVKVGTKLSKGDIIGKVYTDENTNSSKLHFQIWDDKKTLDPVEWISKK